MATEPGTLKPATAARGDAFVADRLARTERRIRTFDLAAAGLGFAAATCAYAALMLAADRLLAGSEGVRQILFLGYLAGAAAYLAVFVVRPLTRRINPHFAARQVEQTVPGAKNSVVNWVDLHGQPLHPAVRNALGVRAAKDLARADLDRAVSGRRAGVAGALAGLAVAVLFALLLSMGGGAFFDGLGRAFAPFHFTGPPRTRTRLTLVRPSPGDTTVPVGQGVAVVAEVDGRLPDPKAADAVRLLYRYGEDDPWLERTMAADADRQFSTNVSASEVRSGFWYKVAGGDAETDEHRVGVRATPQLTDFQATYHFPAYAAVPKETRHDRTLRAVRGSEVVIWAAANRAVRDARLDFEGKEGRRTFAGQLVPGDGQAFQVRMPLTETGLYRLGFTSADGDVFSESLHPVEALPDLPPEVQLTAPGKDVALPADGLLPLEGRAADDFGVRELTLRMKAGERALKPRPYRTADALHLPGGGHPATVTYKDAVDLAKVEAEDADRFHPQAGMEIEYWLEAADACEPKPNVGASKHYRVKLTEPRKDEAKRQQERQQAQKEQQQHEKQQDQQLKQESAERQEKSKEADQKEQQHGQQQNSGESKKENGDKGENGGQNGQQSAKQENKDSTGDGQNGQQGDTKNPGAGQKDQAEKKDKPGAEGAQKQGAKDKADQQPDPGKQNPEQSKQDAENEAKAERLKDALNKNKGDKDDSQAKGSEKPDGNEGDGQDKGQQAGNPKDGPGNANPGQSKDKDQTSQPKGEKGTDQAKEGGSSDPSSARPDGKRDAGPQSGQKESSEKGAKNNPANSKEEEKRNPENGKDGEKNNAANGKDGEQRPMNGAKEQEKPGAAREPNAAQRQDANPPDPKGQRGNDQKPGAQRNEKETGKGNQQQQRTSGQGDSPKQGNGGSADQKPDGQPGKPGPEAGSKGQQQPAGAKPDAGKDAAPKPDGQPQGGQDAKPDAGRDTKPDGQTSGDNAKPQDGQKDGQKSAGKEGKPGEPKDGGTGKSGDPPKPGDKSPPAAAKPDAAKDGSRQGEKGSSDAKPDAQKAGEPRNQPGAGDQREAKPDDVQKAAEDLKSDDPGKRAEAADKLERMSQEARDAETREQARKALEQGTPGKPKDSRDESKDATPGKPDPNSTKDGAPKPDGRKPGDKAGENEKPAAEKSSPGEKSADGGKPGAEKNRPGDKNAPKDEAGSGEKSGDRTGQKPNGKPGDGRDEKADGSGQKAGDRRPGEPGKGDTKPGQVPGQKPGEKSGEKPGDRQGQSDASKPGDQPGGKDGQPGQRDNGRDANQDAQTTGERGKGTRDGGEKFGPRGPEAERQPVDPNEPVPEGPKPRAQKPRHGDKDTVLQLEDLDKVTKKDLEAANLTEKDLAALRQWLREQQKRRPKLDPKEDAVAPQQGGAGPAFGGKRVQPGTAGKPNDLSGGGRALPPPGYQDANETFKRLINKPPPESP